MRERRIVAILGAQGTGKSTLAKALVGRAMSRGERVTIFDPNGAMGGYPLPDDVEGHLAAKLERRSVGLLLADDADRYVPKRPRDSSPWRKIFLTNRHLDIDLLVTARRPQNLPDELLSGVDVLFVFQMSQADVNGRKRLSLAAPGLESPTVPFRFVRWEPKTATGNPRFGRVLKAGGFRMD